MIPVTQVFFPEVPRLPPGNTAHSLSFGGIECGKGALALEDTYGVYFGNQLAGKVQVLRQGLYYGFHCRCQLTGEVVCRLYVTCGKNRESLGVVVPMDDGFGLDTRLPKKRLGEGKMEFLLIPKHDIPQGRFVPIYPEEPFAYLARLKEGFLARQGEQIGVVFREPERAPGAGEG